MRPLFVLVCALTVSQGQKIHPCSLAQELNNYCDARCKSYCDNMSSVSGPRGPPGKDGERGSQGPPGPAGQPGPEVTVNYTAIQEMIRRTVDEVFLEYQSKASGTTSSTTVESTTQQSAETLTSTTADEWTVFQRRQDGSVDFDRTWDEYVNGFGNESGEFWMGLEKLHQLTSSGKYELRIDLRDWKKNSSFAEYSEFFVGSAATNYRLTVSGYSGTAGDSLINPGHLNGIHNGMAFTAKDLDNDLSDVNCAEYYKSGWWFNACLSSNLNGVYYRGRKYTGTYVDGIVWSPWKNDYRYSMKFVEMKLRPVQ